MPRNGSCSRRRTSPSTRCSRPWLSAAASSGSAAMRAAARRRRADDPSTPTMRRPLPAAKLRSSRPDPQPRSSTRRTAAPRQLAVEDEVLRYLVVLQVVQLGQQVGVGRLAGEDVAAHGESKRRMASHSMAPASSSTKIATGTVSAHAQAQPAENRDHATGQQAATDGPAPRAAVQDPATDHELGKQRERHHQQTDRQRRQAYHQDSIGDRCRTRVIRGGARACHAREEDQDASHQDGEQRQASDRQPGATAHRRTMPVSEPVTGRHPDRCPGTGRSRSAWAMGWR